MDCCTSSVNHVYTSTPLRACWDHTCQSELESACLDQPMLNRTGLISTRDLTWTWHLDYLRTYVAHDVIECKGRKFMVCVCQQKKQIMCFLHRERTIWFKTSPDFQSLSLKLLLPASCVYPLVWVCIFQDHMHSRVTVCLGTKHASGNDSVCL